MLPEFIGLLHHLRQFQDGNVLIKHCLMVPRGSYFFSISSVSMLSNIECPTLSSFFFWSANMEVSLEPRLYMECVVSESLKANISVGSPGTHNRLKERWRKMWCRFMCHNFLFRVGIKIHTADLNRYLTLSSITHTQKP